MNDDGVETSAMHAPAGTQEWAPRLPVLTTHEDPRVAEMLERGLRGPDGQVLNIFGTLANHPELLRRWLVFATHVMSKTTLSARDRELLILRTGWNCRSRYEWGQHVLIALDSGLTHDEIERVKLGAEATGWSPFDAVLLRAADDLHLRFTLSDETWSALSREYSVEQMLDVVATVGNYHLVAMLLNSTRVALDAGVPDVEMPPHRAATGT
jgi:4-carboxymuconolactone decarboxylase